MKQRIFRIFIFNILSSALLIISSCESYLDATDTSSNELNDEIIFSNYTYYRGFVNSLYQGLTDYYYFGYNSMAGCYSDELQWHHDAWAALAPNSIISGDYWGGDRNNETTWEYSGDGNDDVDGYGFSPLASAYPAIRKANLVIENIDKLGDSTSDSNKEQLLGQAYFFRAWFHFEIIRRVGGMPYIDRVLDVDEDMDFTRLTFEECVEKIAADCDMAAAYLPTVWSSASSNYGRVTNIAAYALKGMAYLYNGSPKINERYKGSLEYDHNSLKLAIEAYNQAINLYSTNIVAITKGQRYSTAKEYGEIFYRRSELFSDQVIFGVTPSSKRSGYTDSYYRATATYTCLYSPKPYDSSYVKRTSGPTQNLVDAFEMASGLNIGDAGSNYNSKDPYIDRDPRFGYTVLYNGVEFGTYGSSPYVFTTIGDIDGTTNWTGYYARKMWPETAHQLNGSSSSDYAYQQNWMYMRIATLMLDYAEAVNEVYGVDVKPTEGDYTALELVNMIRSWSGHVDVHSNYTTDATTFRDKIRNERFVELCFEHVRWFDLRRWGVAHEDTHRKISRMTLDSNGEYEVQEMSAWERTFQSKHYWYPISLNDVNMLENMEQNPGW